MFAECQVFLARLHRDTGGRLCRLAVCFLGRRQTAQQWGQTGCRRCSRVSRSFDAQALKDAHAGSVARRHGRLHRRRHRRILVVYLLDDYRVDQIRGRQLLRSSGGHRRRLRRAMFFRLVGADFRRGMPEVAATAVCRRVFEVRAHLGAHAAAARVVNPAGCRKVGVDRPRWLVEPRRLVTADESFLDRKRRRVALSGRLAADAVPGDVCLRPDGPRQHGVEDAGASHLVQVSRAGRLRREAASSAGLLPRRRRVGASRGGAAPVWVHLAAVHLPSGDQIAVEQIPRTGRHGGVAGWADWHRRRRPRNSRLARNYRELAVLRRRRRLCDQWTAEPGTRVAAACLV